jgi:uncharacterized protein (TIGR00297 family)
MASEQAENALRWQSKAVLLIVVPWSAVSATLQAYWWWLHAPVVALCTVAISALFGLIVWRMRAGTPAASATGAAITASLMFSTVRYPYEQSWLHGGLMPLLAVFVLTYAATKIGKGKKERLGTGESRHGRNSAQVAANLGAAVLLAPIGSVLSGNGNLGAMLAIAALAEAAADTVSSEIGQVLGGQPRMITTLRRVEPGSDGGITFAGTAAGAIAAMAVAAIGVAGMLDTSTIASAAITWGFLSLAGTFGLLFDSLLGATVEHSGWLNNDSVNFLSTLSAAAFVFAEAAILASMTVIH